MRPEFQLVSPRDGSEAPRNTRVRVAIFELGGKAPAISLRDADGGEVATKRHVLELNGLRIVELTPKRALAAGASYEVRVGGESAGSFTTTKKKDRKAPAWNGVTAATFVKESKTTTTTAPDGSKIRIIRTESTCFRPDPYAVLEIEEAEDETPVLFGVWFPDENGKLDTKRPPLMYLYPTDGKLSLGSASICDPIQFDFPKKKRKLKIAVAAIDEAGNKSKVAKVTLKLSKPASKPPE